MDTNSKPAGVTRGYRSGVWRGALRAFEWRAAPASLALALLGSLFMACSPPPSRPAETSTAQPAPVGQPGRTLALAHRFEHASLSPKAQQTNGPLQNTRLFNASLSLIDDKGAAQPYLAETLPQLGSDSWRVSPDGRMETTYRLKPNLTWHDGTPLVAEDFAFALRVYKEPGIGGFVANPQDQIDAVLTPDPRTIVVQWRSLNPVAGALTYGDLDPLPRHLLEGAFADLVEGRASREGFAALSYWNNEYVGTGPYRLERWDPGVLLEGSAFDGHVLGRPKIARVVVRYFIDENSTLATVLTGGVLDFTNSNTMRFEHFVQLKREWEPAGKGTAVAVPTNSVFLELQQRPEYIGDEALFDLRVRRAIAHVIDRPQLNEGLYNGLGLEAETPVPPRVAFYGELERIMTRYPLDPNRATQLMGEAGFTRDAEGYFSTAQGRRFHLDFAVFTSTELERMQAILSDQWRRAGFDVRTVVMASSQFTNLETRLTLPGLAYSIFSRGEVSFLSSEVGSPANRWAGSNRSGWTHPDYDRLYEAAKATLDPSERGHNVAQMMALVSEYSPGYPLYFLESVYTWVAGLQGPDNARQAASFGQTIQPTTTYWNIHEWTFTQ